MRFCISSKFPDDICTLVFRPHLEREVSKAVVLNPGCILETSGGVLKNPHAQETLSQ